jgi:putative Mg2+ transporter-C (MgtC) family protein
MPPIPPVELIMRLTLAAALGGLIGIEREYHRKPAGLRTNILIALGSALFAIVSLELARLGGTSDRLAAQIVTGVGFLGAGTILRSGGHVQGLTTAATIWMNAAIGTACGIGLYAVAAVGAVLTLIVLGVVRVLERAVEARLPPDQQP